MDIIDIEKMPKNAEKYICKICDFKCSKQSNYKKHTDTPKHIKNSQNDINDIKKESIEEYNCECGKKYNYYSGLWRHKKICVKSQNIILDASISGTSISGTSISGTSISGASISGASISGASISGASIKANEYLN